MILGGKPSELNQFDISVDGRAFGVLKSFIKKNICCGGMTLGLCGTALLTGFQRPSRIISSLGP
jgi:hypothetical protein